MSRRLGKPLWGESRDPSNKKNYPPGMQGAKGGFRNPKDYGAQLLEKQKMKTYYNMTESQFKRTYIDADRKRGDTGANLIALLESRLDAFVYRTMFAKTVFLARQLVSHKHITVNDKVVNIPSYRLKPGDVVRVRDRSKDIAVIQDSWTSVERSRPFYIEVEDTAKLCAKYITMPEKADVPYPINVEPHLIIELYSK